MKLILSTLLVSFLLQSSAFAKTTKHQCGQKTFSSVLVKYCIDDGDRSRNQDLLYVLHGSNGTADDWVKAEDNQDVQAVWDLNSIASPTKITVSFGDEWMFNTVATEGISYQDVFVNEVMPYVESLIPGPHGIRMLKGVSMGGWNGVQLLLKKSELFNRIAIICPVISPLGPFSSQDDINEKFEREKRFINRGWVNDLLDEERDIFRTPLDWATHDPLELVKSARFKTDAVYISCARHDEYGFFEGTERFARAALALNPNVIWFPTNGGHCVVDPETVAHFFTDGRP